MKKIVSVIESVVVALCSEKQEIIFAYVFAAMALFSAIAAIAAGATHLFYMTGLCALLSAMTWPRKNKENESSIK